MSTLDFDSMFVIAQLRAIDQLRKETKDAIIAGDMNKAISARCRLASAYEALSISNVIVAITKIKYKRKDVA